jgi:N-formylglutamate amidohydrolase
VAQAADTACAINAPYAGGHILDRHGRPAEGVHAIQMEFDRTLYLDAHFESPGPGMARAVELLRAAIASLADEATGGMALAAE